MMCFIVNNSLNFQVLACSREQLESFLTYAQILTYLRKIFLLVIELHGLKFLKILGIRSRKPSCMCVLLLNTGL